MVLKFSILDGNDFNEVVSEMVFTNATGATVKSKSAADRTVALNVPNVELYLGMLRRSDIDPAVSLQTKIMRVRK